ncbi:MAG: TFIIH complex serine/threonine-protein kinase subunit kin28 [Peltula sp. TS41687]|nr:MAG: TFIIH complex serine/threonine-protein kinase subunit kin28 [Peltula sp. TS41687]
MALSPALLSPTQHPKDTKPEAMPAGKISKDAIPSGNPESKPAKSQGTAGQAFTANLNDEIKSRYIKDKKIGEGTYANVYLGHLRDDPSKKVAIKKIKVLADARKGLSMDAIREVKFLQELSHPNIIALQSVFTSKNQNLNLVLEYLPLGDLEGLIKDGDGVRYGAADVKAWMGMLGRAVWFCHENSVLHRDIKPNNLLIAADGEVKLADFGLARSFSDPYPYMTPQVITRWYRPPELLFGARHYSGAVDVWSMGCVFAELILRTPFLPGNTDVHQLDLICSACGTPSESNWPGVSRLPDYVKFSTDKVRPVQGPEHFKGLFSTAGPLGVELLMSMLSLDPRKRMTARQILEHGWWMDEPRPTSKEDLPKKGGGLDRVGEDLKRRGGEVDEGRGAKVARKLSFSAAMR